MTSPRHILHGLLLSAALPLILATCGKTSSSMSPTAPSPLSQAPPSFAGATISGSVLGGVSGMTVGAVGSNLRVSIDGSGRFSLPGAPTGQVELQFAGTGLDARLRIDNVAELEKIEIQVKIVGNVATLDGHERLQPDNHVEVEGIISAIDASERTVRVGSLLVHVPAEIEIHDGATVVKLEDLKQQDRIEVRGMMNGAVVEATEFRVEDRHHDGVPEPPQNEVEFRGTVSALGGVCNAISFSTAGRTVTTTDSGTTFEPLGSCSDVKNGVTVQVKGMAMSGGTVAASRVRLEK